MLSKIRVDKYIPILENMELHPSIIKVMYEYFIPESTYFSNGSTVINDKSEHSFIVKNNQVKIIKKLDRLIFKIGELYYWKSINSFNQNNILIARDIYKYINYLLKINTNKLFLGIGGEFMLYFLNYYVNCQNKLIKFIGITNSINILDDANFNSSHYNININLKLVDYNNISQYPILDTNTCVVIQVSKITNVLINYLNNNKYIKNIIIINCHKKDYDIKTNKLKNKYKQISSRYWPNGNSLVGIYFWNKINR